VNISHLCVFMITKCKWVIKRRSSHVLQVFFVDKKQVMWHYCENFLFIEAEIKTIVCIINLLALTLIGNWRNLSELVFGFEEVFDCCGQIEMLLMFSGIF